MTSPWVSRELWRHRIKLGSLDLSLLLVCRVPIPNLDQPNHLFLWACSQATKCSWRKLALKQIYNFQAQLDCQCCSAILLLTHDWFPSPPSITAVPIFYPFFQSSKQLSLHSCMHSTTIYWALTIFQALLLGVCRRLKNNHKFFEAPLSRKVGSVSFPLIPVCLLSGLLWPIECIRNNGVLLSNKVSRNPVTSCHSLGTLRPPSSEKPQSSSLLENERQG